MSKLSRRNLFERVFGVVVGAAIAPKLVDTTPSEKLPMMNMPFTPGEEIIASGTWDGEVVFRRLQEGDRIRRQTNGAFAVGERDEVGIHIGDDIWVIDQNGRRDL